MRCEDNYISKSFVIKAAKRIHEAGGCDATDEYSKMNELPDVRTFITKDCPPFLIFHGTGDTVVPPRQGEALYEALQEKGIESDLYLLEGAEHGDQHFVQKEVKALMLDFLKKHLK